jgi:hypothetical protein
MSLVEELRTEWDACGWTANRRDLFRRSADEIESLQAVVDIQHKTIKVEMKISGDIGRIAISDMERLNTIIAKQASEIQGLSDLINDVHKETSI